MKYYMANSNLFINGQDSTGSVKMFEVTDIKAVMDKYESLGMLANKEVPTGFDQMEGKMEFAGPAPDFFNQVAFPWETTPLTLLGVMTDKSLAGSQNNQQFECDMIVRPVDIGVGKFENQKLTSFERSFKIDKMRILMGGVEQLNIDFDNNVFMVNGVDKWQAYRTLLGQ